MVELNSNNSADACGWLWPSEMTGGAVLPATDHKRTRGHSGVWLQGPTWQPNGLACARRDWPCGPACRCSVEALVGRARERQRGGGPKSLVHGPGKLSSLLLFFYVLFSILFYS
jgi:hypothetical protein